MRISIVIIITFICISFYLPTIHLFTDTLLLPKWYLCIFSCFILGVLYVLSKKIYPSNFTYYYIHLSYKTYIFITCIECLYVSILIFYQGTSSIGAIGTFDNPAGLALCLCIAIPIVMQLLWKYRMSIVLRILYSIAWLLIMYVLYLTKSRTGIICATLYIIYYMYKGLSFAISSTCGKNVVFAIFVLCMMTGTLYGIFTQKTSSTSGRMFILQRSWELIKKHPFIGHGHNGFEKEYMLQQAHFFQRESSSRYAILADEVHHPLNEFIYLWVNGGVFAPLLLLTILILPVLVYIRRKEKHIKPLLLSLLSIFVFSIFSYPFHYPIAWVIVLLGNLFAITWKNKIILYTLLIGGGSVMAVYTSIDVIYEYKWNKAYRLSYKELDANLLKKYEELHHYMYNNYYFLYNYAMTSFLACDYIKADILINECKQYWNGYNRELLAADICFRLQKYEDAIYHYEIALQMCPVRFAPLEGLYKTYDIIGDETNKTKTARKIALKRIKISSTAIDRIKNKCQ